MTAVDLILFLPDEQFRISDFNSASNSFGAMVMGTENARVENASEYGCQYHQGHIKVLLDTYEIPAPKFEHWVAENYYGAITHVPHKDCESDASILRRLREKLLADPECLSERIFSDCNKSYAAYQLKEKKNCDRMRANKIPSGRFVEMLRFCDNNNDTDEGPFSERPINNDHGMTRSILDCFMFFKVMQIWLQEASRQGYGLVRFIYGIP